MLVAMPGGAERLRRVLDDRQVELSELRDRRRATEEMDGHDRARALGHAPRDVVRVEVQRRRVDVGEHGCRAATRDRLRGRVEGERRADHLVPRPDPERVEDEDERVGAVRDADRPPHAEVVGRFLLERVEVGAADELASLEDLVELRAERVHERRVLRLDVNQRDRHFAKA